MDSFSLCTMTRILTKTRYKILSYTAVRTYAMKRTFSPLFSSVPSTCCNLHVNVAEIAYTKRYSTSSEFPKLTNTPVVKYPNVFYTVRNWFVVLFSVNAHLDQNFNLIEFTKISKDVVSLVSQKLAAFDVDGLEGLLTDDVLCEVKRNLLNFSEEDRKLLEIINEDIQFAFPYKVSIYPSVAAQKIMLEVSLLYHVLKNVADFQKQMGDAFSQVGSGLFKMGFPPTAVANDAKDAFKLPHAVVANYTFVREYDPQSRQPAGDWTVSAVNYEKVG